MEDPEEKADQVDGEDNASKVKAGGVGDEAEKHAHTKQDDCHNVQQVP